MDENFTHREDSEEKGMCMRPLILALSVMIVFLGIGRILGSLVSVQGSSMEPSYHSGQLVFAVYSFVKEPELGDVVIVRSEATQQEDYIKRVEGVPGDTIVIRDGILIRNGEPVEEGFERMKEAGYFETPIQLSNDEYVILGDNRNDSQDSRFIGPIEKESVRMIVINGNNREE